MRLNIASSVDGRRRTRSHQEATPWCPSHIRESPSSSNRRMQMARLHDSEDSTRFYVLRLHEAGLIKSSPQKIITDGADWRFLSELKRELKGVSRPRPREERRRWRRIDGSAMRQSGHDRTGGPSPPPALSKLGGLRATRRQPPPELASRPVGRQRLRAHAISFGYSASAALPRKVPTLRAHGKVAMSAIE